MVKRLIQALSGGVAWFSTFLALVFVSAALHPRTFGICGPDDFGAFLIFSSLAISIASGATATHAAGKFLDSLQAPKC